MRRRRLLLAGVPQAVLFRREFRSDAALEAIRAHNDAAAAAAGGGVEEEEGGSPLLGLYNYPTLTGAYAALGTHLFHLRRRRRRLLLLPFSSVEPFRPQDFEHGGFDECYLLDFIGPKKFAWELSRFIPRVIAFDHRQSTLARIPQLGQCPSNLELHIDTTKSSACAVFDYFSKRLAQTNSPSGELENLLDHEDEERVFTVLKYLEDADLRRWELPDTKEFQIGLKDQRAKLNCVTNPHVFEQLLQLDAGELIVKAQSLICSRSEAAQKVVGKLFKIKLGGGLYGECLAIRADGNSDLSHEIALELSQRSAAAGLRPIGAAVFLQRGVLKICLRSADAATDTSEIAKAYGGGGKSSSSSFTLRMDEYNAWTALDS